MKKLLSLLCLVIMYNILCAQTTVVQNIQVKTAQGVAPQTSMPTNGGVAYYDANGIIKKADLKFLLGKKLDSAIKVNDTTLRFMSQYGNTYDVLIRGLYDLSTKGFVDSARAGLKKDSTAIINVGGGLTLLASTTTGKDSLKIASLKDSTGSIGFVTNLDGSVSAYIPISGVTAGQYGDATHVAQVTINAQGRITAVTLIAIAGGGGATNITVTKSANFNTVNSSTGSSGQLDTTTISNAGLQSIIDKIKSLHPFAVFNDSSGIGRDTSMYADIDSLKFKAWYFGPMIKKSINQKSISIDASPNRQVITSGTTATVLGGNYLVTFDPTSTISSFTLTLPTIPIDEQTVEIDAGGTLTSGTVVTTLTISPNSGQTILGTPPTTLAVGGYVRYRYRSSTSQWYKAN